MALWNPEKPRYGPGLGVNPLKPLSEVIAARSSREDGEGGFHARGMAGEGASSRASTEWKKGRPTDDVVFEQKQQSRSKVFAGEAGWGRGSKKS